MSNQRDTTEYKNLALWKEKEGYVIRKGFGRVGCYIDRLSRIDLAKLADLIIEELSNDNDRFKEVQQHKRLVVGSKELDKKYETK